MTDTHHGGIAMPKRPKAVKDVYDALTWLSYGARFTTGEPSKHFAGCRDVIFELHDELESTRQRCAALAARLEKLEATKDKEGL